jgi:hypothetical protein
MSRDDRLYELLPAAVRQQDAAQGWQLRALLRVVAEQVNVVEDDISRLYDNWFVETADDWVVPYIGRLIGYRPVQAAGPPGDVATAEGRALNRVLVPRREIANTIGSRRRKGTLALLELLARDVAGWPARAVEFYRLLAATQNVDALRVRRGRIVDVRDGDALELIDTPFDRSMHTVDARRIVSKHDPGRHNIPSVGLFVWHLGSYSITRAPAHAAEEEGPHAFTFNALGTDTPLYNLPQLEASPTDIAVERNLPTPIRRRHLERLRLESRLDEAYGKGRSFRIWTGDPPEPVPVEELVPADLTDWRYRPVRGQVAVDPELGRIAFPPNHPPKRGVWVSYRYGFSADMGGGEYDRPLGEPLGSTHYPVGRDEQHKTIAAALEQWRKDAPDDAVVEITDSRVYAEQIEIALKGRQTLQLRAANRTRPALRLLDWRTDRSDALLVSGDGGGRFTLDGVLVTGRGMQVEGEVERVTVRHSTLVPGWGLRHDCEPRRPAEPSLVLLDTAAEVRVEHSIVGSILVIRREVELDPERIRVADSIVDATSEERAALHGPESLLAHALATFVRTTVFGEVSTHAVRLGENSIFLGRMVVARRQIGCLRFCWVPPGSRTPRRYHCQPDLVDAVVREHAAPSTPKAVVDEAIEHERLRVRPRFTSTRYGRPAYAQLARSCAAEIVRGADDESELGAFHDLFQPQRLANLRARLDEYTPAGSEAGIIIAT